MKKKNIKHTCHNLLRCEAIHIFNFVSEAPPLPNNHYLQGTDGQAVNVCVPACILCGTSSNKRVRQTSSVLSLDTCSSYGWVQFWPNEDVQYVKIINPFTE